MKKMLVMIFCLIGLNSIAVKQFSSKEEIKKFVSTWSKKWKVAESEFVIETGASTNNSVSEFNDIYKYYVKQWLQDHKETITFAALKSGNDYISKNQNRVNKIINRWAKKWNVSGDIVSKFASATNTNPVFTTREDVKSYNEAYLTYLTRFYANIKLKRLKLEYGSQAMVEFIKYSNRMANMHVKSWFIEKYPNEDPQHYKEKFKEETGLDPDISTFEDAIEFESKGITIPRFYELEIDKL